jgi:hypothetical protein
MVEALHIARSSQQVSPAYVPSNLGPALRGKLTELPVWPHTLRLAARDGCGVAGEEANQDVRKTVYSPTVHLQLSLSRCS